MTKVEAALQWAIMIANDDSHGYSDAHQWGPDYDCSSFVLSAYEFAGIPMRQNGITCTSNMNPGLLKVGFVEVKNCNLHTGAGLLPGDIVLYQNHHTEMYLGNGKLIGSHTNYNGVAGDLSGSHKGREICEVNYYDDGWNHAFRYVGDSLFTGDASGLSAYDYAMEGVEVEPDYRDIDCYVITLDRHSPSINFKECKKHGITAAILEEGSCFDDAHCVNQQYVSPKLEAQVKAANEANIPFGLYTTVCAKTIQEASRELTMLRIYASKYTPALGIWLALRFTSAKAINDTIIEYYRDSLERAGYTGKMGFYVTRSQLAKISWDKWKSDFLLMLVDHVSEISDIEKILTPEFFMLKSRG